MNIIFTINGGLGKSIISTAVIKGIKKKYQDSRIIVISAYPDVFLCNPNVYKIYTPDKMEYFYSDNIENKDCIFFLQEPYQTTAFIKREEHLLKTWFNLCSIDYNGEMPELFLTNRELNFYSKLYLNDKPIFVIQTNGGASDQTLKYSWARDIPNDVAQNIVNYFKDSYNIYHIRRDNQLALNGTINIQTDFRSLLVLLSISKKRLLIDSFAQHACQALGLSSVVCWVVNSEAQFGYSNNINIKANNYTKIPELRNSQFIKFNITGDPVEFPYNDESEIFNVDDIIHALSK